MINQDIGIAVLITIAISALLTYGLRFGGLLLGSKLQKSPKIRYFMEALPGTILLSLVAPEIFKSGIWGGVAALSTALCTYITKNVFIAMIIGVVIVAASRQ